MIDYESFLSRAGQVMQGSAIRRMGTVLAQKRDIISFAPGYPAPETFPWHEFQEIARELLAGSDGSVLQYGPTRGYRPLLETISLIMGQRGVPTTPERLLITTGSQQGLDLIARVLLDPGDVVLVELPTYTGAITAFRNVLAEMVGVKQEADGIDLSDLDDVYLRLKKAGRRVRFVYVVPNFQNPTGLLIGLSKRKQLLEWAARRDVLIVEDDPYRELFFEDSAVEGDVRPIKADDEEGRVIYLSSFSKTLAPGFRVAWIDASEPLASKFEMAKQAEDLLTGSLDQRVVFEACRRGILHRQLPLLRRHYQQKRDVMVQALRAAFGTSVSWPAPRGGFFLWAALPPAIDADRMVPRAVDHGVIYVAGEAFFVNASRDPQTACADGAAESRSGAWKNLVRLSFSAPSADRIREGVSRLASTVRAQLEALSGSPEAEAAAPPPPARP
jgi:2-aminoadipate transaminase